MTEFADPLAAELWRVRQSSTTLAGDWTADLPDPTRARLIADALLKMTLKSGASQVGFKFGATDEGAQGRLGTDKPFTAPIFDSTRVPNGGSVSLARFAQPRIEAEIAVIVDGEQLRFAPCIEIADCHYPGWRLSIGGAIADFGLHGVVVLGEPREEPPPDSAVRATLFLDHIERTSGEVRAGVIRPRVDELMPSPVDGSILATGRITDLLPLRTGLWVADFGELGVATVSVVL